MIVALLRSGHRSASVLLYSVRALLSWAIVGMTVLVAACGGGGGTDEPQPPEALYVYPVSPEPDSAIRTDTTFSFRFSEPIDPATANEGHITLSSDHGPVPIVIGVSDMTLTVTPAVRLRLQTTYRLEITQGVKGTRGETLAQAYQLTASTTRIVFDASTIVPEVDFQGGAEPDPLLAATDLDGDGRKDLATVSRLESDQYESGYTLRLYRQESDGRFTLTQHIDHSLGEQPYSVYYPAFAAIDIDHDGVDELVVAENQTREDASKVAEWALTGLRVFKRGVDGRFSSMEYIRTAYVQAVRVGDVDGDGHPDIVGTRNFDPDGRVYGFRDSGFQVMLSRPGGLQLQAPVVGLSVGLTKVLTDLDRDGDLDLLFNQQPGVLVYVGDGRGSFTHDAARSAMMSPLCPTYCEQSLTIDLNDDGWPDFIARGRNDPLWMSLPDGSYALQAPQSLPGVGGGMVPQAGDLDKNGHPDLVWMFGSPLAGSSFMPLFGTGSGQLELSPSDALWSYHGSSPNDDDMLLVDMDGDGYLDVLVAEHNTGVILLRQVPDRD